MNNEEQPQQQPDPYQIPGIVEQHANTNHSTDDMKPENSTINQFHNNQQPQEQDIVPDVSSAAGSQHVIQTSDSSNLQVMAAQQQQQTYKEQQQMTQQNSETRTNSGQIQDISLNQQQQQQPDLGPSLGVYTPESSTNSVHSIHGGSFGNGSLGDQTPNANNSGVGNTGNNDQSTTSVVHTNNVMESPNSISSVDLQQQQQTMQQPPQHYNCSTGTGNNADMNLQQQHVSQQHQQSQQQQQQPQDIFDPDMGILMQNFIHQNPTLCHENSVFETQAIPEPSNSNLEWYKSQLEQYQQAISDWQTWSQGQLQESAAIQESLASYTTAYNALVEEHAKYTTESSTTVS